LKFQVED